MRFKPSIFTNSILKRLPNKRGEMVWVDTFEKDYKNYEVLKKDLPEMFRHSSDGKIHVHRSRRGQWGEWFEIWEMVKGKPKIVEEGWM